MKRMKSQQRPVTMRKVLTVPLVLLGICLVSVLGLMLYLSFSLELWSGVEQISGRELTTEEKIADFRYLTSFVRSIYPYNDFLVTVRGLDDLDALEEEYLKRAGETTSNSEFFKLVYEYVSRLKQGDAHNVVYFGGYQPANTSSYHSLVYGIKRSAYNKLDYWDQEAAKLKWYAYADLKVRYQNGAYVLLADYRFPAINLPEGTVIKQVDGLDVDDYVLSLQNKTRLFYDGSLQKNFSPELLSINTQPEKAYWAVDFLLPDETTYTGDVRKRNTPSPKPGGLNHSNYPNEVCRELSDEVGYIWIASFGGQYINSGSEVLQGFMASSQGRYDKLIIDVRGNGGGEPLYYIENLIRPLLQEPVEFSQYAAIRKGFFAWMGLRYYAYRTLFGNQLLNKALYQITGVHKVKLAGFNPKDWEVFKITKEFRPANSWPFHGKLYILTDRETFSAADSFVAVAKAIEFGTVIGSNTGGGGNIFIAPIDLSLPHSGLILGMNVELTFNEGEATRPNQIFGTSPHVELQSSTYPTALPRSLEVKDLLEDSLIQWVLAD